MALTPKQILALRDKLVAKRIRRSREYASFSGVDIRRIMAGGRFILAGQKNNDIIKETGCIHYEKRLPKTPGSSD